FFFSSRRRHTRSKRDWSSDVCSSDLTQSSRGQRTVVSEPEIQQALAAYRRTTSTDEAGFAKEVRSSIAKIQRAGLVDEQGDDFRSEERRVGTEQRSRWSKSDLNNSQ